MTKFNKNYSDPLSMDGTVNNLKAFMSVEHVDISPIVDLGFDDGYLFRKMLRFYEED